MDAGLLLKMNLDNGSGGAHPSHIKLDPLCQVITPVGMLGYGFDENLTRQALQELASSPTPTAIILDSGSTDGGPLKLAVGLMTAPRTAYERDLRKLLALSHEFNVPTIISSAGGNGADLHVDECVDIIHEITEEGKNSNIMKSKVLASLNAGEITGCGVSVPALTEADVNDAFVIVAQMSPEPFIDAMAAEPDFDIIIGGRAYDPSPYIAFCVHCINMKLSLPLKAFLTPDQLGGFAFMGKIMECGALCSTPKSSSSEATIYCDGTFDIVPLISTSICLPSSVAAHSLYEKSRPDILPGPGGDLDLNNSKYEQLIDGRSVRVTGAKFSISRKNGMPYTVKLEAAKTSGYRTMFIGGIRDPILIKQIDSFLIRVKQYVAQQYKEVLGKWEVDFHVYGANGIMGSLEPGYPSYQPREIFLVGEALASTQKLATSVASAARIACVHGPYPEQSGTSGNFAMGLCGKLEVEMSACAEFCIYHLMPLKIGEEGAREFHDPEMKSFGGLSVNELEVPLFRWKMMNIGKGEKSGFEAGEVVTPVSIRGLTAPPPAAVTLNFNNPRTLCDIAPVIRSKNSGPYDITLDVIFGHESVFNLMKNANLLNRATIARLYHLSEDEIIYCGFYEQALAFKATLPRKRDGKPVSSGSYMESDVHASQ